MPKKHRKKSVKNQNSNYKSGKNKKKKKNASYKFSDNNRWLILSCIIVGLISILLYYIYLDNDTISSTILGQPKSPAKQQQINELISTIDNLEYNKMNELISKYNFDFINDVKYPILQLSIEKFFINWSERIADNKYKTRLNILKLLILNTNIADQTQICLSNYAAKYRLIDSLKIILAAMSSLSINQCFYKQNIKTNNTIFHNVCKSKAASFARLLLKFAANNNQKNKLKLYSKRLYIKIPQQYIINNDNHLNINSISQSKIKKWMSHIDVKLIIKYAQYANIERNWFYLRNNDNYTAIDYFILNHGSNLNQKKIDSNLLNNGINKQNISQSVTLSSCNFEKDKLFDNNSCYPSIINNWNDFDIYWRTQTPVIIRNKYYLKHIHNMTQLIERFGDISVMVAEIPYAFHFGMKAWSIPLKEYINVVLNGKHQSNLYAFDNSIITKNQDFNKYFDFSIGYIKNDLIKNNYNKTYQFALGPASSGAPPHWHQPAFNGLFLGKKMWFMFPPKNSLYSSKNIVNWINEEYKNKMIKNGQLHRHYCFIQEKGDIVFVPNEWSHAVSNVEQSLAIAIEIDV